MATSNFRVKRGIEINDSAIIGGALVASGLRYPTTDGSSNDVIKTDGNGNLTFGKVAINELEDVILNSLKEGGLLQYDSANQVWRSLNTITEEKHDITSDGGFY